MLTVVAGVIEENGKILLAKRKKGGVLAQKWEFPGGKLEPGETLEQALARELMEEFEAQVKVNEFIGSSYFQYDHITVELMAYNVTLLSSDLVLHDHDTIEWVLPEDLEEYTLAEADIPIAKKVKERFRVR